MIIISIMAVKKKYVCRLCRLYRRLVRRNGTRVGTPVRGISEISRAISVQRSTVRKRYIRNNRFKTHHNKRKYIEIYVGRALGLCAYPQM